MLARCALMLPDPNNTNLVVDLDNVRQIRWALQFTNDRVVSAPHLLWRITSLFALYASLARPPVWHISQSRCC